MRKILFISLLLILFLRANSQTPVGSWSDHLAYNTAKCLAVGSTEIYVSTGSSIIIYNKEFAELRKLSRTNGLTESGISTIAWSEENKTLIIAYTTGNIDLMKGSIIYNIPDISRKYIPGNKEINRIKTNGKYAYMASSFGIVLIDINKREIYDTWKPGDGSSVSDVWDITFGNNRIYAATSSGVYYADVSNPGLAYFGNWSVVGSLPNPSGKYTALVFSGGMLYANLSVPYSAGDYVYIIDGGSSLFSYIPGVFNTSFDLGTSGFTISSSSSLRYYINGVLGKTITSYGGSLAPPNVSQAVVEGGNLWIADLSSGLVKGENMSAFSIFTLPGPVSNNAYSITSYNGKTIIGGGGGDASWNNQWRSLEISVFENNGWTSVLPMTFKDPMRALIDPEDNNHFFVSTWGGGLLEYQNNVLKKQYKESNSPMQTIIAGQPYVRICGLAMDKSKNLWITQTGVPGSIKVLRPDDTWIVNPITIDVPTIGDIIIAKNGYKWIVLPRGYGLFVLDDNNTPDVFTDDRSKKMLVKDSEGRTISSVYSIAEDLDGNIWVGTDQGPLIYYNPEKVFTSELNAFHIKIPRNDGTDLADYMLGTEIITSIAVDGANRKWLGTFSSGAYLLSPDGTKQIKNYNEQNSPILSNSIVALSVDNKTSDVWFGTSKGVQSIRGDAKEGEDKFTNVYTFPNPVREDFTGNVTITGLMRDSQIRITDISGNLVYQTVSDGGLASWDLKTYNGKRVATGVYLVFCASNDGAESMVTKMLVIR